MRISSLAILLLSLVIGCAATVPQVMTEKVKESQEIIPTDNSLRDMVTRYLVHYIGLKTGLEVERNEDQQGIIELVSSKDSEKVILRVRGLELSSPDILSRPVKAALVLELRVINEKGVLKYEGKKSGGYEVLIDSFMESEAKERIADFLVKDALKQFVNDPEFRKIMAKHKYGTLGSIVSIF